MFGLVFDVDGVLLHGKKPIPGAVEALQAVVSAGVPYLFLTNGTGYTEKEKAEQLSKLLSFEILSSQIVMASTPMRNDPNMWHKRVLMVTSSTDVSRRIAQEYGWTNTISVQEYAANHPQLYPSKHYDQPEQSPVLSERPIEVVAILEAPADWGEALQICLDILVSDGIPDVTHASSRQTVKCVSGNPDLDYAAAHTTPRITLGAFRKCLEKLFEATTGRQLSCDLYGKPYHHVYDWAEKVLRANHQNLQRIYAIGDNPKSDIRGANSAGSQWMSVLVRTGCFKGDANDLLDPAHVVCDDVREAVDSILNGSPKQAFASKSPKAPEKTQSRRSLFDF